MVLKKIVSSFLKTGQEPGSLADAAELFEGVAEDYFISFTRRDPEHEKTSPASPITGHHEGQFSISRHDSTR